MSSSNRIPGVPFADWSYTRRVANVTSAFAAIVTTVAIATLFGIDSGKLTKIHQTYTAVLSGLGTTAGIVFAATLLAPTHKKNTQRTALLSQLEKTISPDISENLK